MKICDKSTLGMHISCLDDVECSSWFHKLYHKYSIVDAFVMVSNTYNP